jgi:acyl dehydratase
MKHRKFTADDQVAFAELSGDYNPLHVNAVAARRLLFGASVVPGIHLLLWGLDTWLENCTDNIAFHSIKAAFSRPVRTYEETNLRLKETGKKSTRIELSVRESLVTLIDIEWNNTEQKQTKQLKIGFPPKNSPHVLAEDEIEAKSGTLDLYLNIEAAGKMFPNLTRCAPPTQIAALLGTTRLVGMECPGLNSVYSELTLSADETQESTGLNYQVTKLDRRFGLVLMNVTTPGMAGAIKAFIRPEPQGQDSYPNLKKEVSSNEFSGQRALVIGGSRGLGEVTAKLLAAGAAEVTLTYHQGEDEAHRIVEEIVANGGTASCFRFNALVPQKNTLQKSLRNRAPTHLYYFATPFIFSGIRGIFSADIFKGFCGYYVTGFINTINALKGAELKNFFYPSSVAVDDLPPDMGEYSAAKIAGEMLCTFLEKNKKDLTIYRPRLPRMGTDQTVSLLPTDNQDPVPVMLQHLRSFRDIAISHGNRISKR